MATLTMRCASRSDVGRRANNEDAVLSTPRLVAVADGVGGANAGEVASRWAINEMIALERRRLTGDLADELSAAVVRANATLGFLVACRPEWAGMGTTLVAVALANEGTYLVASVGDSRAYLLRDGGLTRLTRDQSLVQKLIDEGAITPAQARSHPQRSVVLQALDGDPHTFAPPVSVTARADDRLLLCSDGLSDVLDDATIAAVLAGERDREQAAAKLVSLALDGGGRDNVSAVVADVVGHEDPAGGWLDALPAPSAH
jgi:serine/threonine protein phosphatase PrpC